MTKMIGGEGMLFGAGAAPMADMMMEMQADGVPEMMMMRSAPVKKPIEVRKTFPETWLFDTLEFDSK